MFDVINGLPVHPLVVHAVVVLLPLAIVGTLAIAARPRWRGTYGPLVVAVAAVATALLPVATASGEALEERVGEPGSHAELGEQLIWFALPLLVLDVVLVVLARRHHSVTGADDTAAPGDRRGRRLTSAVAVLSVLAALAAGAQVYRVGDSGARAAWGDQVAATGTDGDGG